MSGSDRRVRGLPLHVTIQGDGLSLVLLHGFTGSAGTWQDCAAALTEQFTLVMPDLIGHGASPAPAALDRYRMPAAVADVVALLDALDLGQVDLLGYSMGGRLALHIAAAHPERVAALVLESASPGLAEEAERAARRQGDEAQAARIERDGVAAFVAEWARQPLFASQHRLPASVRKRQRAERLANSAIGLANSLRGMGTGSQEPLWDRLPAIAVPTLLLTGAEDTKYCQVAAAMAERMPAAQVVVVPDAGHTVHLEQPAAFARHVLDFLKQRG